MLDNLCPMCNSILRLTSNEIYSFDPLVSLEVLTFDCDYCGHEEKIEKLKRK